MQTLKYQIDSVADVLRLFKDEAFSEFARLPATGIASGPKHRDLFGIWFRGQAGLNWRLMPSVFRPDSPESEELTTWLFMLRAAEHRATCRSQFDWLSLMRHYGLPTRLLDWSENVLVALYMACSEAPKENGALWILNVQRLNSRTKLTGDTAAVAVPSLSEVLFRAAMSTETKYSLFGSHVAGLTEHGIVHDMQGYRQLLEEFRKDPEDVAKKLSTPLAVYPFRIGARMIVQQSVFTIHGGRSAHERVEGVPSDLLPPPIHLEDLIVLSRSANHF